jgi:hypothetical protein
MEVMAGFEPAHRSFADSRLNQLGHITIPYSFLKIDHYCPGMLQAIIEYLYMIARLLSSTRYHIVQRMGVLLAIIEYLYL